MKKNFLLSFAIISVLLLGSCKKDATSNKPGAGLPVVETIEISAIRKTSAYSGGTITSDGGNEITARGICWSPKKDPTIMDSKTTNGAGIGTFTSFMEDLINGETYYVRSYATNSAGTSYGSTQMFFALQIGQTFQGGSLIYILHADDPGYVEGTAHGLILSQVWKTNDKWFKGTYSTVGGTNAGIGTGKSNTDKIITALGSGYYAASSSFYETQGEYNDWYLPSKDELNKAYLVKDQVALLPSTGYAWTSTEAGASSAWIQAFSTGAQSTYDKNGTGFFTISMRSF